MHTGVLGQRSGLRVTYCCTTRKDVGNDLQPQSINGREQFMNSATGRTSVRGAQSATQQNTSASNFVNKVSETVHTGAPGEPSGLRVTYCGSGRGAALWLSRSGCTCTCRSGGAHGF